MNSSYNPYAVGAVAEAPLETRTDFVRKTYLHLAGAIGLFVVLETLLISMGAGNVALQLLGTGRFSWLIVLGAFMGVSWIANKMAYNGSSKSRPICRLGSLHPRRGGDFPAADYARRWHFRSCGSRQGGRVTGFMVLGLTAVAFTTKKDFTFLGGVLKIGGMIALGVIVASIFMGGMSGGMGLWFSVIMVIFASGCILYNTSAIMYRYAPGQHVAASLSLFASVALLFWYILQLFMSRD